MSNHAPGGKGGPGALGDREFVLAVACLMLKRTWPWVRDGIGLNWPDAWLFKDLFDYAAEAGGLESLHDEQVEWLRRQLLKYERQLRELGVDYERLRSIRVAPRARYWRTVKPDVKLVGVEVKVKGGEVRVIAKWRDARTYRKRLVYGSFGVEEVADAFRRADLWLAPLWDSVRDNPAVSVEIGLGGDEAMRLLKELGLVEGQGRTGAEEVMA